MQMKLYLLHLGLQVVQPAPSHDSNILFGGIRYFTTLCLLLSFIPLNVLYDNEIVSYTICAAGLLTIVVTN